MSLLKKLIQSKSFQSTDLAGINRLTYITLTVAILFSVIWLFTAKISSAVIINGSIKIYRNRIVLQHPDGGKIAHVYSTEGQSVDSGHVILDLDNPQLESNLRNFQRQLFSESIRQERLKTEISYPLDFKPDEINVDSDQLEMISTEKKLFRSRHQNLNGQINSLNEQILNVKDEIKNITNTIRNDELIIKKYQDLADQGYVAILAVVNAKQALNQHQADLARSNQRLSEMQQKIPVLINDFKNNAATEYRSSIERSLEIEEKLRPTDEALKNLKVVTNVEGEIVNLTKLGPGSVLGAKEVIAEIVPKNRSLILEGNLPIEQVAFVKEGMTTQVTISQLKMMGGKELKGRIKTISADTVSQGNLGTWSYIVQVEITEVDKKDELLLKPGMPAEIHIQTGLRTPYDYLSRPITAFMNRALKEPN
jgi:HlyD family type I secretion membrane fusion protein